MKVAIGVLNFSKKKNTISIIRTAEHFGIRRVFVIGKNIRKAKDCMNCHKHMIIKYFKNEEKFIEYIKAQDYNLILVEKTKNSRNISNYDFPDNIVLMSGHEQFGFSDYMIKNAKDIIHISNIGLVNCMNTAAAFAISVHKWFEQKVKD